MDDEETSTGHSPLDMAEEGIASSFPAKRRRVDSGELDESLIDTASSTKASFSHYMQEEEEEDDSLDPSSFHRDETRGKYSKRERIRRTVSVLRRIIPGGEGKDTASVLDEAIQYLKSLKLRTKSFGPAASSL